MIQRNTISAIENRCRRGHPANIGFDTPFRALGSTTILQGVEQEVFANPWLDVSHLGIILAVPKKMQQD